MHNKRKVLKEKLEGSMPHFYEFEEEVGNYKANPSKGEEANLIIVLAIIFDDIRIISKDFAKEIQEISGNHEWFRSSYKKANLVYDKAVAQYAGITQLSDRLVDELQLDGDSKHARKLVYKALESAHGLHIKTENNTISIYELLNLKSRDHVMTHVVRSAESLIESLQNLTNATVPATV